MRSAADVTRANAGERDTIAAIATSPGSGAIGIVRLSGPGAVTALARVVGREPDRLRDRRMVLAEARDPVSGERLDEVMCVVMRGPRSFTGEDVAEIHGHGGSVNMARLLRAVVAAGARHAEPGEFTRRAFENHRLDLTRAEAVLAVIEASSERALRLAQEQLAGRLGERVGALRRTGIELLADLEASIDFPEEGLELARPGDVAQRANRLAAECEALAATFEVGRALRDGIEVALCGPVNSGKSSLFNRLLGSERALVAAEPGTTRDFVEAHVLWNGIGVTLIDTAGLRDATSDVERRGIDLGVARARRADVEVHLVASDDPAVLVVAEGVAHGGGAIGGAGGAIGGAHGAGAIGGAGGRGRVLTVVSKGDKLAPGVAARHLVTSAVTGQGIEKLVEAVVELATAGRLEEDGGALLTSERQRALVIRAEAGFARAAAAAETQTEEVTALEVREGVDALAQILGEQVGEEMLDALFARFCIGK